MKKILIVTVTVLVCLVLCAGSVLSAFTFVNQKKISALIKQNAAEDEDGIADTEKEDDIVIAEAYTVKSTLNISDAYKSGDASKLSDAEKETLDMAKAVIDSKIEQGMSDYEKEKAIYDYLVGEMKPAASILTVIPETEQDNDNPHDVLKYKTAVCVGYATTFRLFMQMLDIECKVVHNKDLFHTWDLVKLDGDWYHVDCYSDNGSIAYLNFNMNDTQAAENHDWTREFYPAANGTKYNYMYTICEELEDIYSVPDWLLSAITDKKSIICCTFKQEITEETQLAAKQMTDSLYDGLYSDDYSIEYQWTKNDAGRFMLSYFISYYSPYEEELVDEETMEKINDAINAAKEKYGYEEYEYDDEEDW